MVHLTCTHQDQNVSLEMDDLEKVVLLEFSSCGVLGLGLAFLAYQTCQGWGVWMDWASVETSEAALVEYAANKSYLTLKMCAQINNKNSINNNFNTPDK